MTLIRAASRRFPAVNVESGCVEPLVYGSNILDDPSFESWGTGFGPLGNEIPGFADDPSVVYPFLNWSDDSQADKDTLPSFFYQSDASSFQPRWFVASANPRTGTYHIRTTTSSSSFNSLWPGKFMVCDEDYGTFWGSFMSARVMPGDTWEFSFWAQASAATDQVWSILPTYYTNDPSLGGFASQSSVSLPDIDLAVSDSVGAYHQYSSGTHVVPPAEDPDTFLPAAPYYLEIMFRIEGSSISATFDVDDIALSLTAA